MPGYSNNSRRYGHLPKYIRIGDLNLEIFSQRFSENLGEKWGILNTRPTEKPSTSWENLVYPSRYFVVLVENKLYGILLTHFQTPLYVTNFEYDNGKELRYVVLGRNRILPERKSEGRRAVYHWNLAGPIYDAPPLERYLKKRVRKFRCPICGSQDFAYRNVCYHRITDKTYISDPDPFPATDCSDEDKMMCSRGHILPATYLPWAVYLIQLGGECRYIRGVTSYKGKLYYCDGHDWYLTEPEYKTGSLTWGFQRKAPSFGKIEEGFYICSQNFDFESLSKHWSLKITPDIQPLRR